jgi:uncharacterized membrane protein
LNDQSKEENEKLCDITCDYDVDQSWCGLPGLTFSLIIGDIALVLIILIILFLFIIKVACFRSDEYS